MLDINSETVCHLIDLAREFHTREEDVDYDELAAANGEWDQALQTTATDDPILQDFQATVRDLEPDQLHQLVALFWLGRGDYSSAEWNNAVEYAAKTIAESSAETTTDYLLGHPLLVDYWLEGLAAFNLSCE